MSIINVGSGKVGPNGTRGKTGRSLYFACKWFSELLWHILYVRLPHFQTSRMKNVLLFCKIVVLGEKRCFAVVSCKAVAD